MWNPSTIPISLAIVVEVIFLWKIFIRLNIFSRELPTNTASALKRIPVQFCGNRVNLSFPSLALTFIQIMKIRVLDKKLCNRMNFPSRFYETDVHYVLYLQAVFLFMNQRSTVLACSFTAGILYIAEL